ncbi:MAG: putative peptide zinc metalloprotease protein [Candidatus Azotimanducaceae bacterium]|jgi:putative peptide zinc metalloprotease protein
MDGTVANPADPPKAPEAPGSRPEIRQDLNLYPAGEDEHGDAIWHLHDPLANKFYQMQERDVQLLALIGQRNVNEVAETASRFRVAQASPEEVAELFEFLRRNNLVRADDLQHGMYAESLTFVTQRTWWQSAIRNPLFFRIPLWKPDRFIEATLPYVSWMASRSFLVLLAILGMLGLYLVVRQFDQFLGTFLHFFSWSGLFVYLMALFLVKVFHELGHAYTAKQMGCRVPIIGVAFMVGWPILYTDTSDAWKVAEKSKRLRIGAAGVGVELGIAVLSLFLWSIAPEGSLKSAFFLLATTTWILSVFVNFNPFMRFDGYYLLSDLINMPNLEPRSFGMARWWMREKLFGLGVEPPETIKMPMVFFAFTVWVYRFFLFLGIALLVYGMFFKAAGLALFVVEIIYFILRPLYNEMKEWWNFRESISWNGATKRTAILVSVFVLLFVVPWYSDVSIDATIKAKSNDLFLPEPGLLTYRTDQKQVSEGDLLFELESLELALEIEEVSNRFKELSWIRSSLGFDSELRNEALIVESELQTQSQRLRSLVDKRERLKVTAPFDGELVDLAPDAMVLDWLASGMRLATVIDKSQTRVEAFLPERQLSRVEVGMKAKFIPDSLEFGTHDLIVTKIEFMGSPELKNLYVASTFGGGIAVRENSSGELITVQSHYRLELQASDGELTTHQVIRGVVVIDGKAESLFSRFRKQFVAVFIRETGF